MGNIGVNVFKHICKEDGVLVSYFVNASDSHCEDHDKDLPPCCEKEKKDKDCCNDEVEYFKIKLDFSNSNDDYTGVNSIDSPALSQIFDVEFTTLEEYYSSRYVNPPPISGREILLNKQVWII